MLQKRHLPDQPLEYLLKLRCIVKSGSKYREKWFTADRLRAEFAVGDALIKQFEASKVGQLAIDTYLSKRRSLPSPKSLSGSSSDEKKRSPTSAADGRDRHKNVKSNSKAVKRKLSEFDQQRSVSNCDGSMSAESLKSTDVTTSNDSTPLSANKSSTYKPSSFYGDTLQHVSHHKNFAKRLLLSAKVPNRNLVSTIASKDLKLPNLLECKSPSQKPIVVSCKREDSDSDADVRYSLATDHSDTSSDWGNARSSSSSEKKRRKLTLISGMKKSKSAILDSKQPKVVTADADVKFKASSLLAGHSSYTAGIAR